MEMYLQGISTRKVKAVTEELCGHEFSSSSISQAVLIAIEIDREGRRNVLAVEMVNGKRLPLEGHADGTAWARFESRADRHQ